MVVSDVVLILLFSCEVTATACGALQRLVLIFNLIVCLFIFSIMLVLIINLIICLIILHVPHRPIIIPFYDRLGMVLPPSLRDLPATSTPQGQHLLRVGAHHGFKAQRMSYPLTFLLAGVLECAVRAALVAGKCAFVGKVLATAPQPVRIVEPSWLRPISI